MVSVDHNNPFPLGPNALGPQLSRRQKAERVLAVLGMALAVLVLTSVLTWLDNQSVLDEQYAAHMTSGTIVTKTYDGKEFLVAVDVTDPTRHRRFNHIYVVREQNFDRLHVGDVVDADKLN